MQSIVESFEETGLQIHVSYGVDSFGENHASWHLSISVGPAVLNSLHVELVHYHHDSLFRALVDPLEHVLFSPVNENLLESREENIEALNMPVDQILVEALLCELGWLTVVQFGSGFNSLVFPKYISGVLHFFKNILR